MTTLTATDARRELFDLVKGATLKHKVYRIHHRSGDAVLLSEEDYESLQEMAEDIIDFWAENGLEHERCGEMIERIGLANFLEAIGIDPDPNMVDSPRQCSYVRMDGWDEEAIKWFDRQAEAS